jgi:glutaminyl-peptide cyclotransferase
LIGERFRVQRIMPSAFSSIWQQYRRPIVFAIAIGVVSTHAETPTSKQPKIWEQLSGEKAFAHVEQLVGFGPHPSASEAIEKCRAYIEKQLTLSGWTVTRQIFTNPTPRGQVRFVNLIARVDARGDKTAAPSFLLCSHYDTKSFDTFRFVGANDGGSSTGLLLELARVLGQHSNLARKVELVFFDGEEAYEEFSDSDGIYGSRYFAKQLTESKTAGQFRGGLLFDMVGDRSLNITLPPDSPAEMARDIFTSADALKLRSYFTYFDRGITDDHTPLNTIGIPVVDVIDFDFAWWHTAGDTLDKVSPQSLQIVGSVAAYYLSEFALK